MVAVYPHPEPDEREQGIGYDIFPGQHVTFAAIGHAQDEPQVDEFIETQARQGRYAEIITLEAFFSDVVIPFKRGDIPAGLSFREQGVRRAMVDLYLS